MSFGFRFVPVRLMSVFVVIAFGEWQLHQFLRFQAVGGDDANGVGRCGVVDQIFDLFGQADTIADYQTCLGDPDAVLRRAVPSMGIGSSGYQCIDGNAVPPTLATRSARRALPATTLMGSAGGEPTDVVDAVVGCGDADDCAGAGGWAEADDWDDWSWVA